ncbi:hypothetical protein AC578_3656 [Pseudocercospora eumusae]|uniref:Protein kinase domain-containing protein n=1 Tax=Pseudocercospora eumusae TaxID=321146 RepID=A0A139GXC2_9PEZI|nr:hypothetical protein AC578_3656 [Pseudocercospora eumusae]
MADPFSITVGVLSLIKAAKSTYSICRAASNAPKELVPLVNELDALESVVAEVHSLLDDSEVLSTRPLRFDVAALNDALEYAEGKAREAQDLLSKVHTQPVEENLPSKVRKGGVVKRLNKIRCLTEDLAAANEKLRAQLYFRDSIILHATTASLETIDVSTRNVRAEVAEVAKQIDLLSEGIRTAISSEAADVVTSIRDGLDTVVGEVKAIQLKNDVDRIEKQLSQLVACAEYFKQRSDRSPSKVPIKPNARAICKLPSMSRSVARHQTVAQQQLPKRRPPSRSAILEAFTISKSPDDSDGAWSTSSSASTSTYDLISDALSEQLKASVCRLNNDFERSSSWFPEQYTQKSKVPQFLAAHFLSTRKIFGNDVEVSEWHVWWRETRHCWKMIRITEADEQQEPDCSSSSPWKPRYIWKSPVHSHLPCQPEAIATFLSDETSRIEDVVNLRLSRRSDSVTSNEEVELSRSDDRPYEDDSHDSLRSARELLNVKHLQPRRISEEEVVVLETVSGFTTLVRIDGKKCIKKALPIAPFHLEPFKYELKALILLRGQPGIVEFVGLEVDDYSRQRLKGYIRAYEDLDLTAALGNAAKPAHKVSWACRELWAYQIINGVRNAHAKDIVIGTLDVNEIAVDDDNTASLLHIAHQIPLTKCGCLAPEFRGRSDLADSHMTAAQDVFALGLVLWLIAQVSLPEGVAIDTRIRGRKPWWKTLFCRNANCRFMSVALEDNKCTEEHSDPIDLPPSPRGVPDWYENLIARCRKTSPSNRCTAQELSKLFKRHARSTAQRRRKIVA